MRKGVGNILGWKKLKFNECIKQINTGLNPRKNFVLGNGNIKYITAKNLNSLGTINFDNCDYINEEAKKIIHKRSDIQIGDILFSSRAPVGQCHLIKEEPTYYDIGESIFSIRVNEEILRPSYFSLYLTSDYFVKLASRNTTGSVIQEIRIGDLMNTEVIVPPFDIQDQIAQSISLIDNKLVLNNSINADLNRMLQLLFEHWFIQFDFPDNNGRPYKTSNGKMIYSKRIKKDIPVGWEIKNIMELCDWVGGSQPPKSNFLYKPSDGYIRFIQNRDYSDSKNLTYIPVSSTNKLCDELDIMMDKYGDAGRIRFGLAGAYNVALAKIDVHDTELREYIRCYLNNEGILKYLKNACMASTRSSLNEDTLSAINIPIPPKGQLLDSFNNLARSTVNKILFLKKENEDLSTLREFLLPLLMNGQISIKN